MNDKNTEVSMGALFRNQVIRTILLSALLLQVGIWVRNTMVLTMTASGWLKKTFSLLTLYEISALLLIIGAIALVPLFKQSAVRLKKEEEL